MLALSRKVGIHMSSMRNAGGTQQLPGSGMASMAPRCGQTSTAAIADVTWSSACCILTGPCVWPCSLVAVTQPIAKQCHA